MVNFVKKKELSLSIVHFRYLKRVAFALRIDDIQELIITNNLKNQQRLQINYLNFG